MSFHLLLLFLEIKQPGFCSTLHFRRAYLGLVNQGKLFKKCGDAENACKNSMWKLGFSIRAILVFRKRLNQGRIKVLVGPT